MTKYISPLFFSMIAISVFCISSCKEDEFVAPVDNLYKDYYPVNIGYWVEYSVDSIVHLSNDDVYLIDTSIARYHFFIREQIDSSFIDGEGEKAFIVSRYKRTADSLPWEFTALWTSKLSNVSLERVEENRRFIRLSFPFTTGFQWNGNAFNELPEEDYYYDEIYSPKSFAAISIDSTVSVIQNEFISNINRIIRKEIYGNHVGLLYKINDSVGVANTMQGQVILSGLEYEQTIINYKQ